MMVTVCADSHAPRLLSEPALPQGFAREDVNPDPLERRVLLAVLEEVTQRLRRVVGRNEQFARPPFERLSAKFYLDRRRREVATFSKFCDHDSPHTGSNQH